MGSWRGAVCAVCIVAAVVPAASHADELHSKNSAANRRYDAKRYEEALKDYDNLILEYPGEPKLKINKGSALYRLGQYDKAEEAYGQAKETKDKNALAALHYNLGNAQFMEGERMSAQNGQQAMEKYKAALENYIKALDLRPSDKDAKWNVQLAQKKIRQMEQRQQQQQNDKDDKQNKDNRNQQNKNDQGKNKQDQNKDQRNKNDQQKQDQQDKNQQQKDQQQSQDQNKNQEQQKPEPTPQQQKQEDMKKDEAKRLIEQFSDDDKDLNKKPQKVGAVGEKKIEKDW
jgi:Ca-activated chloride channel homolog